MTVLPLTPRQREALVFVNTFMRGHGYAPSLRQICGGLGLRALATAHKHLTALEAKGYIVRPKFRSRSMSVVVGEHICPTCQRPFEAQS